MNLQLRKQRASKKSKKAPIKYPLHSDDNFKQLDVIQRDINEVMQDLKLFTSDNNQEFSESDDDEWDTEDDDEIKYKNSKYATKYVHDDGDSKALNWDHLIPFIKDLFDDLQKVKKLDRKADNVVKRIHDLTGTSFDEFNSASNEVIEVEE